jgi:hypothetical protein
MKNKNTAHYYEVGSYAHLDHSEETYKVIKNNPPGMVQGVVLDLGTMAVAISTKRLKPAKA